MLNSVQRTFCMMQWEQLQSFEILQNMIEILGIWCRSLADYSLFHWILRDVSEGKCLIHFYFQAGCIWCKSNNIAEGYRANWVEDVAVNIMKLSLLKKIHT